MITEIVLAAILILVSLIWMYIGIFQLGIWIPGVKASSGFVPTIFAAITLLFSVVMIISAVKAIRKRKGGRQLTVSEDSGLKGATEDATRKAELFAKLSAYIPVFFTFIGIIIFKFFGVVIFSFVMTFTWLMFISAKGWKKSLVISCIVTLFIYLVFELWLSIPFPGQIIRL